MKRELVTLLLLPFGCHVTVNVLWLCLTDPGVGLQFVIVFYPDFFYIRRSNNLHLNNLVGPAPQMIYATGHSQCPFDSREEDFERLSANLNMAVILAL